MSEASGYLLIVLAIGVTALNLWAIYQVWCSAVDVNRKFAWWFALALLPVVGLIAWLLAGPRADHSRPVHQR
ncbi:MAG: PLD nuclease N-terminal domain-containing protein [Gammaproteobacteria bacterium]|nr:PLD nuclease N-terminal domain-containing protein [Gammaproteobacteria bacterium]MBU1492107.1 PLD nuclease N-terminal domain-containing protein [Gammaproteobacteria bacterium]MBU2139605.1 PLD nuclease N-terminal domain-containing protein [Gammaproteobacteria bacterium]MBU2218680.1 PLD nuclease N-terminal domain-containing protein [Gammaproteobacteria bacterium]MBU2322602.1 PLD nuclease N-terminal domain-containing protein [Gammaproteobacteria bacterium]